MHVTGSVDIENDRWKALETVAKIDVPARNRFAVLRVNHHRPGLDPLEAQFEIRGNSANDDEGPALESVRLIDWIWMPEVILTVAISLRLPDIEDFRVPLAIEADLAWQCPARAGDDRLNSLSVQGSANLIEGRSESRPAAQPAGRVESPQRIGSIRLRGAGEGQKQRPGPVAVMDHNIQQKPEEDDTSQTGEDETPPSESMRAELGDYPSRGENHAGQVGGDGPVQFTATRLKAEGKKHAEHWKGCPPQVAPVRVLFAPRPMDDHGRCPDDEPDAEHESELPADIGQRAEEMKGILAAAQPVDMAEGDPIVGNVPEQDRQTTGNGDRTHAPEPGTQEESALFVAGEQKHSDTRNEESHVVFREDAERYNQSSKRPGPPGPAKDPSVCQDKGPAPAARVRRIDGHERRSGSDDRDRQRCQNDEQGQFLALLRLHREDVQAQEQQAAEEDRWSADGNHFAAGEAYRPRAEQFATGPDDPGNKRSLAVVAPVEMTRPVPVMSLVGGQIEPAMVGEENKAKDSNEEDEQDCSGSANPAFAQRDRRTDGHQHSGSS